MSAKTIPPGWRGVPNVGPAMAQDFTRLGFPDLASIKKEDPKKLYDRLCRMDGQKHDICVLDTFEAVIHQARGGTPKPWWFYSRRRLANAPRRQGSKRAPG